jgi:hypothetical protein
MRIVCERSGGFAGLSTRIEVDTDNLTAAQKRKLQTLIEQSQLLDQRTIKKRKSRNAVADGFQYDLTVTTDDRAFSLSLNEGTVSAEMLALLDWLVAYQRGE